MWTVSFILCQNKKKNNLPSDLGWLKENCLFFTGDAEQRVFNSDGLGGETKGPFKDVSNSDRGEHGIFTAAALTEMFSASRSREVLLKMTKLVKREKRSESEARLTAAQMNDRTVVVGPPGQEESLNEQELI